MTQAGPIILHHDAVSRALAGIDVRAVLARAFAMLADGRAVQPPQTVTLFPDGRGDVITYLGVLADEAVLGAKLSPYLVGPGGPVVTAWTLLLSMTTGAPLLLCDARRLTIERTAGTTALAVDLLAAREARTLAVVGTGALGLAHLRHVERLREWAAVRLCSPSAPAKAHLPRQAAGGVPVTVHADVADAVAGADVVLLCTSSGRPVLDVAGLGPGTLVTSISTNAPDAHEVAPAALAAMEVYCDYAPTTPTAAGEMRLATAAGGWAPDRLRGDLPALVAGSAPPPSGDRVAFFRSVGLGLEDVALATAVLRSITREAQQ